MEVVDNKALDLEIDAFIKKVNDKAGCDLNMDREFVKSVILGELEGLKVVG